jgi:two-component system, NarL family, nitrate/nitrite response regulator NarL
MALGDDMAKVLTADRQPLLNQALEALLTNDGRHEVVGRCSVHDEIPLAVRRLRPDVLLLDAGVAMSGTPTVIEQALAERPDLKVLVLALEMDLKLVVDAVGVGALGVVLKTSGPATVASAVEDAVGSGELEPRATVPQVFRQLLDAQHWVSESPVHRLSLRERQVLALLGRGWSNESIGSVLYISPHTVRTHVQNILEKLGLHSRLEAATFAMERADELPAVREGAQEDG